MRRSTRCDPRKPAPPVIKARISSLPFRLQVSVPVKRSNCVDYVALCFCAQLGVDRYREGLLRSPLCLRKIASIISEVSEAFLHVQRKGIVDLSANALFSQPALQFISVSRPYDKLIVHVKRCG